jgi:dethiobiotin synthetase
VKLLFVTATNTDIGKTYASLKLIDHFSKHAITVGVCKPIETGVTLVNSEELTVKSGEADASRLLRRVQKYNSKFKNLNPIDITAYTFPLPAAPFCADIHSVIKIDKIKSKIDELSKLCDLLIVEGAGGLMVPIKEDYMMIDLIKELNTEVLLITPSKLGCINDTMLNIETLNKREIKFDWCVNLFEDRDEFSKVTQPFYDRVFPNWWNLENKIENYIKKLIFI